MFSAKDARLMSNYNKEKEQFKQKKYEKKLFKKIVKRINKTIKQSVKDGDRHTALVGVEYCVENIQKKLKDLYEPLGYNLTFEISSTGWYQFLVHVKW